MKDRKGGKNIFSPDDVRVWRHVTRSVTPLVRRKSETEENPLAVFMAALTGEVPGTPVVMPQAPLPAVQRAPALARTAPPPLAPLVPKDLRRTMRLEGIDGRLDLHGMTRDEARAAVYRFLNMAQARGWRLTLIITGKGRARDSGEALGQGVLRREVPLWLSAPQARAMVVGFSEARPRDGGSGALYVRIRKQK